MAGNYVKAALTRMHGPTRRALLYVARDKANTGDHLAELWWAVYAEIVDLETEATELAHQARRDGQHLTDDPALVAQLEALLLEDTQ